MLPVMATPHYPNHGTQLSVAPSTALDIPPLEDAPRKSKKSKRGPNTATEPLAVNPSGAIVEPHVASFGAPAALPNDAPKEKRKKKSRGVKEPEVVSAEQEPVPAGPVAGPSAAQHNNYDAPPNDSAKKKGKKSRTVKEAIAVHAGQDETAETAPRTTRSGRKKD